MAKKCSKRNAKKNNKAKSDSVSYRLKCTETANGLSHFVMYGDVPKEKAVL
jgi:hypothetical protein